MDATALGFDDPVFDPVAHSKAMTPTDRIGLNEQGDPGFACTISPTIMQGLSGHWFMPCTTAVSLPAMATPEQDYEARADAICV
jgi:hypothetical protein